MFSLFKPKKEPENMPEDISSAEYSMDFSGAERMLVIRTDYKDPGKTSEEWAITDGATIQKVVELLRRLPKEGTMMIKMGPVVVHELVAYRQGKSSARVTFYDSMLKLENTAFLDGESGSKELQEQLFDIIQSTR